MLFIKNPVNKLITYACSSSNRTPNARERIDLSSFPRSICESFQCQAKTTNTWRTATELYTGSHQTARDITTPVGRLHLQRSSCDRRRTARKNPFSANRSATDVGRVCLTASAFVCCWWFQRTQRTIISIHIASRINSYDSHSPVVTSVVVVVVAVDVVASQFPTSERVNHLRVSVLASLVRTKHTHASAHARAR